MNTVLKSKLVQCNPTPTSVSGQHRIWFHGVCLEDERVLEFLSLQPSQSRKHKLPFMFVYVKANLRLRDILHDRKRLACWCCEVSCRAFGVVGVVIGLDS